MAKGDITITNNATGQEIRLKKTNDIKMLENQYVLLGMNGLAYSPWANDIQKKLKELKKKNANK